MPHTEPTELEIRMRQQAAVSLANAAELEAERATIMLRPSMVLHPRLSRDGNRWCALHGVAGFGASPELACVAFDAAWVAEIPGEEG